MESKIILLEDQYGSLINFLTYSDAVLINNNKNLKQELDAIHYQLVTLNDKADWLQLKYGKSMAIGRKVLTNSVGAGNLALGYSNLFQCTTGSYNTALGIYCLQNVTTGAYNVAVGSSNLNSIITSGQNTAIGYNSFGNTTGTGNTGLGYAAGCMGGNGSYNIAVGSQALYQHANTTGNIAIGYRSQHTNKSNGNYNCSLGYEALYSQSQGNYNTMIGYRAGYGLTTGANNTAIGNQAMWYSVDGSVTTVFSNSTCLGQGSRVSGHNQIQLGSSGDTVYAQRGLSVRSDRRDKRDIQPLVYDPEEFILGLNPVQFRTDPRERYTKEFFATLEEYAVMSEEEKEGYSLITMTDEDGNEITNYRKVTQIRDGTMSDVRLHNGFIAQEVKELADNMGFDFAGFQDHTINGGSDVLTLAYEEFISPMVATIQAQQKRIVEQNERLEKLESLVNQLISERS